MPSSAAPPVVPLIVVLTALAGSLGCDSVPVTPPHSDPAADRQGTTGGASARVTSRRQAPGPEPTSRGQTGGTAQAAAQGNGQPVHGSVDPATLTHQEKYPRVRAARRETARAIESLFAAAGLRYPAHQLLIRIFKADDQLELWAQPGADRSFVPLKTYPICARSGTLGPKRRAGDRQVPEGFYRIDRFNPASRFHLSLGLDYPNASDKLLSDPDRPGGDIFIHGSCVTIGCVPLTDRLIKELYIIALDAHEAGRPVAVHVFPGRMDGASWTKLEKLAGATAGLLSFWKNLRVGYQHFETQKRLPTISVDSRGRYSFR